MVILRRQCPSEQLRKCKETICSVRCAENQCCTNTMHNCRVTERRDGIEVAWSEEEKGGERKERARRRGGRGGEASMGQGNGRKVTRMLEGTEASWMSSQEALGKC